MSTPAGFVISESEQPIISLYSHWDGYPKGNPLDVMQWLNDIRITNALTYDQTNVANGVNCLIAQLIAAFKKEPGGWYVYPTNKVYEMYVNYIYHIDVKGSDMYITAYEKRNTNTTRIFQGTPKEYINKFGQ